MPKMKTKSSAKKRFKVTGTGKVVAAQGRQAARDDQADEQVHPQRTGHDRSVRRRCEDRQVLHALRPLKEA